MKPAECHVGMIVLYQPSPGVKFMGRVREEPWQLGSGEWVTHLVNMEPAYGDWRGTPGRTFAHAACLAYLEAV